MPLKTHQQWQYLLIKRHDYERLYSQESENWREGCALLGRMNSDAVDVQLTEICEDSLWQFSPSLLRRVGWSAL